MEFKLVLVLITIHVAHSICVSIPHNNIVDVNVIGETVLVDNAHTVASIDELTSDTSTRPFEFKASIVEGIHEFPQVIVKVWTC